jgi:hypothetical protein
MESASQQLNDMVTLAIQSVFVQPYKPISLLLIGHAESGRKTSMMRFRNLNFVYYINEMSSMLLKKTILPDIEKGVLKCLLIPDIPYFISRQKATKNLFLETMEDLMEKINIITSMTVKNHAEMENYLKKISLYSKFIPFSFTYPMETVIKIMDAIARDEKFENTTPKIITEEKVIEGNPELFKAFCFIPLPFDIKTQRNMQNLARANAMLNGRDKVEKEDIDKVLFLSRWINYKMNYL